ncbi:MAG TPA: hypothetical protein VLC46_09815 [Thermoanaerobaculia bacterium]|jgi:hypothetical protein|nr:hypothetical protein [Thermoanaerobaculia bacterium]
MEIKYSREPVVGEVFEFSVVEYTGTAHIEILAANKVWQQRKCSDPPCHEKLAITADLRGQTLTISVIDDAGASAHIELFVVDYNSNRTTLAV